MRPAPTTRDIRWEIWSSEYVRIAAALSLDQDKDRDATRLMHAAMEPRQRESRSVLNDLSVLLAKKPALVFGCGPSLDEHIDAILPQLIRTSAPKIAADGATSALLERDLKPEIIVTDLDGDLGDIAACSESGSRVVLHAHGDNIATVLKWLPQIRNVLPVTQTEPTRIVHNFGGFTDGDKCLYLASAMGASRLFLAGMEFGAVAGRRSKPRKAAADGQRKASKLEIGSRLCRRLLQETDLATYSLPPAPFPEVQAVQPDQFCRVLEEVSP